MPPKPDTTKSDRNPDDIVRTHIGWMVALAERIVRDRELARDVVQEAFMNAFKALGDFDGRSSVKTWLHRITVNAALMKLRKMDAVAESPIDQLLPEFDQYNCRIEPHWQRLMSLEQAVDNDNLREAISEAISRLPESYRVVLQLRDVEGYSTAEVADALEISVSNVKVRLHRARAAMKKLLEPILRDEDFER